MSEAAEIDRISNLRKNMAALKVFSGNSNHSLATAIASNLDQELGERLATKFANGECRIELNESVRGSDVFIIQSGDPPVNDNLMELLLLIQACKMDSASKVTAVIPLLPYARQDKTGKVRAPISGKVVASMISAAGADGVITMDLHSPQVQGFFDIPVDNLTAEPAIISWIKENVEDWAHCVIVSPDAGGMKRVTSIAAQLNVPFALIHKEREQANQVSSMTVVTSISLQDKVAILVDDIADACVTICMATTKLLEAGVAKVFGIVTHGIFSGEALAAISGTDERFEAIAVTNTVEQEEHMRQCPKIRLIDVSGILAEAVWRSNLGQSVSDLYIKAPGSN